MAVNFGYSKHVSTIVYRSLNLSFFNAGRRKPFDELLSDQTVAKRRLTEVEPSNTQRHSTPGTKRDSYM